MAPVIFTYVPLGAALHDEAARGSGAQHSQAVREADSLLVGRAGSNRLQLELQAASHRAERQAAVASRLGQPPSTSCSPFLLL